ncbi:MAG: EamA family transporter RarD [Oleiphilaceae bacterium]|nr:EamA family transporter RarD [Oleiphilaceae bacterium]
MTHEQGTKVGLLCALSAFALWGLFPIYFKAVASVNATEVLAHRIIWSVVVLALVLSWRRAWGALFRLKRPALRTLFFSSLFVSSNWLIFIWAVANDRVLETSLGYYINPLLSVVMGMVFLRERLRKAQVIAFFLALLGVINQVIWVGYLPWVALALAITFGSYGLLRKQLDIGPMQGLFMETLLMLPLALGYCLWLWHHEQLAFGAVDTGMNLLLMAAGIVTIVPLLLFAAGARRLPLTTVGITQYTTPSMTFFLAIFLYDEAFSMEQLLTFVLIWTGLVIFTVDGLRQHRKPTQP